MIDLREKKIRKLMNEYTINTYTCECGHRVFILKNRDKEICTWCGKYVFKSKKEEFKYRLYEERKKRGE
jgi:hypothetical protein